VAVGFLNDGLHLYYKGKWRKLKAARDAAKPEEPVFVDSRGRLWTRITWSARDRMTILGAGAGLIVFGVALILLVMVRPGKSATVHASVSGARTRKWVVLLIKWGLALIPGVMYLAWQKLVEAIPQATPLHPYRHLLPVATGILLALLVGELILRRWKRSRARAQIARGTYTGAAYTYEQRLASGTTDPMDYEALAYCYANLGIKLEEALAALEAGSAYVRNERQAAALRLTRGLVNLRLGRYYDAVAELGKATEGYLNEMGEMDHSSKAAECFLYLGEALAATNDVVHEFIQQGIHNCEAHASIAVAERNGVDPVIGPRLARAAALRPEPEAGDGRAAGAARSR